jgi:hypothetical protein
LDSGFVYVHGRDHKFRPIIVFNIHLLDPKTCDIELITDALTFLFEYIIDEMMLPGQVENWVFITNLKGMGISSVAVPSVRKLFAYLQTHYKCRLHKMYLINASNAVYVPWQIAKKLLDGDTVEKVQFYKTQKPANLLLHANPSQIEERFGGSAPNATHYWPPIIPSSEYFLTKEDGSTLITKKEYFSRYQSGSLVNMKICQAIIGEEMNKDLKIETSTPGNESDSEIPNWTEVCETNSTTSPGEDSDDIDEDGVDYVESMSENISFGQTYRQKRLNSSFLAGEVTY